MRVTMKLLLVARAFGFHRCYATAAMSQLERMHFSGRWWRSGDGMKHSWGVGSFTIRFRGSSQIAIRLHSEYTGGFYYTCSINDGIKTNIHHPNDEHYLTISTNLEPSSEYKIWCGRNNEASWGKTTVYGVVLDDGGELLQAEDPNADGNMLRMEFIGDSITAGFKVTAESSSDPATIANQNVFQSYAHLLAEAWKTTDYQVIAKSGVSILDYGTTGVAMPLEWPCREFWDSWQGGCPESWDFSSWTADVVLINLGTNGFAFGNPTQQQFRQAYLNFIREIRAEYTNALIACIEPLQHSCGGEYYPVLSGIVDGIEQAINDTNDPKVIHYKTGTTAYPWLDCSTEYIDYTHPTEQGNKKFAAKLYEAMQEDVCLSFPSKCSGNAPTSNTMSPKPTTNQDSPSFKPTSTLATPTVPPSLVGIVCTAVDQSELPEGSWATTDNQCGKCAEKYPWWPCNTQEPPLCHCSTLNA